MTHYMVNSSGLIFKLVCLPSEVVSLSLPAPPILDLESLEVSLVLDDFHEPHG